jgi:hypothetical protein
VETLNTNYLKMYFPVTAASKKYTDFKSMTILIKPKEAKCNEKLNLYQYFFTRTIVSMRNDNTPDVLDEFDWVNYDFGNILFICRE